MLETTGVLVINEMIDVNGLSIDVIPFVNINIRNLGTLIAHNGKRKRTLVGCLVHVYPGGVLRSTFLEIVTEELVVDVLGVIEVNGAGFGSEGCC